MDDEADAVETPDGFLTSLGERLKAAEGIDTDLVDVLTAYILKAAPPQNAVAVAKDAILKLAIGRANSSSATVAND